MTGGAELERLLSGQHSDPHSVLGAHRAPRRRRRPDAASRRRNAVAAASCEPARRADRDPTDGLFEGVVRRHDVSRSPISLEIELPGSSHRSSSPTPTPSRPRSARSTCTCSARAGTSSCGSRARRAPAARSTASPASRSRCGHRRRVRCRVTGDFDVWNERAHPMRSLGSSGVWELFVPESTVGRPLQVLGHARRRRDVSSRPIRSRTRPRCPPRTASVVDATRLRVARRRVDGRAAARVAPVERAGVDLRGASRVVAPRPRLHRARARSSPTT